MSRNRNYNRRRNYGRGVSRAMSSGVSGAWHGLIESLDLSDNIMKARDALDRVDAGAPAFVTMVLSFIMTVSMGFFAFQFDLFPTYFWVLDFITNIKEILPDVSPVTIQFLILAITLTPTAVELFAPRYGIGGLRVFSMMLMGVLIFDAVTDTPNTMFVASKVNYENWGLLEPVARRIIPMAFLFFFSYMAEVLAFVSGYVFLKTFWIMVSRRGKPSVKGFVRDQRRNNNQQRNQNNQRGKQGNNQPRRQKPAQVPRGEGEQWEYGKILSEQERHGHEPTYRPSI